MSRPGRVRKKSTKLADFESSEDLDLSPKRKSSPVKTPSTKLKLPKLQHLDSDSSSLSDSDSDIDMKEDSMGFPDPEDGWSENVDPGGDMLDDVIDSDEEDDDDDDDEEGDLQVDENPSSKDAYSSQANSLYFSEKKRLSNKDIGGVKRKKNERKDKGKARFTAYMLWARAMRPKIVQENPMMDFAGVNKRLGEMWNLVPYTQKHNWKRKAKKQEARGESGKPGAGMISTGRASGPSKACPATSKNKLMNKGIPHGLYSSPQKSPKKERARSQPLAQNTSANIRKKSNYQTPKSSKLSELMMEISPPSLFKVTGTGPIDVAAHLKLLGESLNNIGQKLKEHEGQIAVSGSLSVLLDSMLCVLGPLASLSNQLEETQGAIPEQTLSNILDNIAYIMPGIV